MLGRKELCFRFFIHNLSFFHAVIFTRPVNFDILFMTPRLNMIKQKKPYWN